MPLSDLLNEWEYETSLHYPQGQGRSVSKNKLRLINFDLKLLGKKNHKPTLPKYTKCPIQLSTLLQSTVQLSHFMEKKKKGGENLNFNTLIYLNLYFWLPLQVDLFPHHLWYLSVAVTFHIFVTVTLGRTFFEGPGKSGFASDPSSHGAEWQSNLQGTQRRSLIWGSRAQQSLISTALYIFVVVKMCY